MNETLKTMIGCHYTPAH